MTDKKKPNIFSDFRAQLNEAYEEEKKRQLEQKQKEKEARERGKHIEKSIRNGSQRLNDSLNDEQLMAAFAITRGNITVRDGDEYMDLSLGNWSDDDDNSVRSALASALNLDDETAERVEAACPPRPRINR